VIIKASLEHLPLLDRHTH